MTTSWEFTATQLLRFDDRTARRNRPWPAGSICRGASGGASVRRILWHGRNGLTSHIILLFGRVRKLDAHAAWRLSLRRQIAECPLCAKEPPFGGKREFSHPFPMLSSKAARW